MKAGRVKKFTTCNSPSETYKMLQLWKSKRLLRCEREFTAHGELKPAACSSDCAWKKFRHKVDVSKRWIRKEQWDFAQVMAFKIKQEHSCLWLEMLSSLIQSDHRAVQGVRYLPGDQQIWSGNESYPLPSKSCEDLSGTPKRTQGMLISVRH